MISVIIHHSQNRKAFLEEALHSVINQSNHKFIKEVIIVENTKLNKKSKSPKVCKSLKIKHIKLNYYIPPSYRLTLAGLKHVKEKYVAYLADDDMWDKDHIERSVESLSLNKNVVATFSSTIPFQSNGRYWIKPEESFAVHFASENRLGHKYYFRPEDMIVGSLLHPLFHFSTLVGEKEIIRKSINCIRNGNPFDTDRIIPLEIMKYGLVIKDNRFGAFIRRHDKQESARIFSSGEGNKWWEATTTQIIDLAKTENLNLRVAFAERMRRKKINLSDLERECNSMGQVNRLIKEGILVKAKISLASYNIDHPKKSLVKKFIDYRIDRKIFRPIEQLVKKVRNYFKKAA
jgi:glycosyltransferase involved in cell wall biosynthesis